MLSSTNLINGVPHGVVFLHHLAPSSGVGVNSAPKPAPTQRLQIVQNRQQFFNQRQVQTCTQLASPRCAVTNAEAIYVAASMMGDGRRGDPGAKRAANNDGAEAGRLLGSTARACC